MGISNKIQHWKERLRQTEAIQLNTLHYVSLACIIPLAILGSWQHWLAVLFVYVLLQLGSTVGYHRLITHRGFETHKSIEYILLFLGGFALNSSAIFWKSAHLNHHRYADKPEDTHSPEYAGIWNCLFNTALLMAGDSKRQLTKRVLMYCKKEMQNPLYRFQFNNYLLIIYGFITLLALINPMWALIYLVAAGLSKFAMALIASYSHRGGNTHEDGWLNVVAFGEGLHTRHHKNPREVIWSNFDLGSWLIKLIRI
jgi:stearoyl-CoA desaturase (delta-9 desaturase)